jgi:hypothetical protein
MKDFMRFTDIQRPQEFRDVTRAHVIASHDELGERISPEDALRAAERRGGRFD